jgi:hypothetical protein
VGNSSKTSNITGVSVTPGLISISIFDWSKAIAEILGLKRKRLQKINGTGHRYTKKALRSEELNNKIEMIKPNKQEPKTGIIPLLADKPFNIGSMPRHANRKI